jgi:hypothetical protein
MKKEDIVNGLGRTVITNWGEVGRITKITKTYFIVDFPEKRSYFTSGKLNKMPQKKVYFDTTNPVWNIRSFTKFDDTYEFKLKVFKECCLVVKKENIEENILPSIEESLKLVKREPRRTKSEIERAKMLGYK